MMRMTVINPGLHSVLTYHLLPFAKQWLLIDHCEYIVQSLGSLEQVALEIDGSGGGGFSPGSGFGSGGFGSGSNFGSGGLTTIT